MSPAAWQARSGPASGDRVTALTDERDAQAVEGLLQLRYVPSGVDGYVQVDVLTDDGRARSVVPDSIRVVSPGAVPAEDLERDDPVCDMPGWRPVRRLAEARRLKLLQPDRHREGGTWQQMSDQLDMVVRPLLDAGWVVEETFREDSWEYGDSVSSVLARGEQLANPELFEDGGIILRPGAESKDLDDPDPALGTAWATMSPAELQAIYRHVGWLP